MSQLSICIERRLASLSSRPCRPFIFKVNDQLRKQNKKAYEPEILAVGPYHRGKVNLGIMEEHKLWYLKEFLNRKTELSVGIYVRAMEDLEKKARECYAESIKLEKDEFVEMMLLDGCFIIELFHKYDKPNSRDPHDPIFQSDRIFRSIRRDLLLFENQIPLSILQIFVMIGNSNEGNPLDILVRLVLNFFPTTLSNFPCSETSNNHLLGLVHHAWYSSIAKKEPSPVIDTNHGCIKGVTKVLESAIKSKKCKNSSSLHDIDLENVSSQGFDTNHEFIKSVTELREAGIKFQKIESSSFLDVKFENGIIKIPSLAIDDETECLFRNLIAYEQYSGGTGKTYMTDYTTFMDCLINSPKDVEILRHSGIIDNWLGDDKVVSTMFNKMGNHVEVNVDPEKFYYGEVFKEVNKYCKHRRHGWMAYLRYNYCNSPWNILSVIMASVFLLLTVIQTGCSILQV